MKRMTFKTGLKKAKEGWFQFQFDAKIGINEIKYQTPSGKWKDGYVELTEGK